MSLFLQERSPYEERIKDLENERANLRLTVNDMNQLKAEKGLLEDEKRMLEQTLVRTNAYIFGM